jgi:L-fucose mutarotase
MLKGIHPLLTPDVLHALASMGHGDELAIVDANFPSVSVGRRVVAVAGASAADVLDAVLTLLPLDAGAPPALTMAVTGDPEAIPEPVAEFAGVFAAHGLGDVEIGQLDRHQFYARARDAFVVLRTGEMRPYGNILLVKGVVNQYPPAA